MSSMELYTPLANIFSQVINAASDLLFDDLPGQQNLLWDDQGTVSVVARANALDVDHRTNALRDNTSGLWKTHIARIRNTDWIIFTSRQFYIRQSALISQPSQVSGQNLYGYDNDCT